VAVEGPPTFPSASMAYTRDRFDFDEDREVMIAKRPAYKCFSFHSYVDLYKIRM
jgi:hypothetical protein